MYHDDRPVGRGSTGRSVAPGAPGRARCVLHAAAHRRPRPLARGDVPAGRAAGDGGRPGLRCGRLPLGCGGAVAAGGAAGARAARGLGGAVPRAGAPRVGRGGRRVGGRRAGAGAPGAGRGGLRGVGRQPAVQRHLAAAEGPGGMEGRVRVAARGVRAAQGHEPAGGLPVLPAARGGASGGPPGRGGLRDQRDAARRLPIRAGAGGAHLAAEPAGGHRPGRRRVSRRAGAHLHHGVDLARADRRAGGLRGAR